MRLSRLESREHYVPLIHESVAGNDDVSFSFDSLFCKLSLENFRIGRPEKSGNNFHLKSQEELANNRIASEDNVSTNIA